MNRQSPFLALGILMLTAPVSITPVIADDTCSWSAQMEDDEGGRIMVASSCSSDPEIFPSFRLFCGNERISVRYYGVEIDPEPPLSNRLVLTSGGKSLNADVVYEAMDGAYAAYVAKLSPIISLLKTGNEVSVTLQGLDVPRRSVSLKGSSAAIDKLLGSCS